MTAEDDETTTGKYARDGARKDSAMPDRTATPALGLRVLQAAKDLGDAEVYNPAVMAELINQVGQRAAEKAIEGFMHAEPGAPAAAPQPEKRAEMGNWARWGVGMAIVVLGAWWGLGRLIDERPTEVRVEKMIQQADRQHPESKEGIERNSKAIGELQRQYDRIEVGIKSLDTAITDLKKNVGDLARRPPR